mgnify:CR=1 FL=1
MIDEIVPVELKEEHPLRDKLLPILLAVVVFALDQITKLLVVLNISPYTIGVSFFGDFLRIIHVYNPGIAFSMGTGLSEGISAILFSLIPLAVIIVVLVVYFRSDDFTPFQRWTIMGIIGGGLGNLFDRFFRSDPARTRETGGTGLGLSIAKWIVDRHGGHFEVISYKDIGTRITVCLPNTPVLAENNNPAKQTV